MLSVIRVLARALAATAVLALVVQCGGSFAPNASPRAGTVSVLTSPAPSSTAPDASAPDNRVADSSTTTIITTAPAETTTTLQAVTTIAMPVLDPNCPATIHAAVIDRERQRAWLCDRGVALPEFVITTARTLPDPGTFGVYDKDIKAWSAFGGHHSTMTHFVAFTVGENTGARVGFHTVPVLSNGEYAQPLDSVGTEERHGDTSGCIRVLPEQGQVVWDWLDIGDEVRVIN